MNFLTVLIGGYELVGYPSWIVIKLRLQSFEDNDNESGKYKK